MSSRFLPLALVATALAAAGVGLEGLAGWLGLLTVPAAAATAFVAVSDILEGRSTVLRVMTSGLALVLVVVGSAARESAAAGAAAPQLATWALLAALLVYALPAVAWVLQPVRLEAGPPVERRLRRREVEELLSRAA
jgi:hypothetical protein